MNMKNGLSSKSLVQEGLRAAATVAKDATNKERWVGGFVPFTTLDFPGYLAAVVFLQGCFWRCTYCHNPHLQHVGRTEASLPWQEVDVFLQSRKRKLDGVVFSGGDPLAEESLEWFIERVRELGFLVALHTSGLSPERLEAVLPSVDWVGFDVKAPFQEYASITQVPDSGLLAEKSLDLLAQSGIPCEVRVTAHPSFLSQEQVTEIAQCMRHKGVSTFALQRARTQNREEIPGFYDPFWIDALRPLFQHFVLR